MNASNYDYVAFIDGDCVAPANWLSYLVQEYTAVKKDNLQLAAVGGTNIPDDNAPAFVKSISIALDSYAGSFNSAQGRQFGKHKQVKSLANLNVLYDKQVIYEVGGYDESLKSEAEDADINYRISCRGYDFVFLPGSYVYHKMRATPSGWYKNMFRYGKGRARLLKRYPKMWNISFFFPILYLIVIFSTLLFPINRIFMLGLLYVPAIIFLAIKLCIKNNSIKFVPGVILIFFIQHFGYAIGELYGLVNPRIK